MSVQFLTSFDPQQFFKLGSAMDKGSHRLDTKVSGFSIALEFSGRLQVTTADGDKISLVTDLNGASDAGAIQSSFGTPQRSGTVSAGFAQSARAGHVGLTVTGDLNETELTDLEKLFNKISNIIRGFFQGQDEDAKAHTVNLAEGFRGLESLSSLDLAVEIVRSVTVVSASGGTPGGAPATVAAIPQPSNGTTAPTPSPHSRDATHLALPVNGAQFAGLIQQALDALNEARVETEKVRQHLSAFIDKLREEFVGELRQEPTLETADHSHAAKDLLTPREATTDSQSLLVAYRATREASISVSIQV